jgi:general secretion pathway protein A
VVKGIYRQTRGIPRLINVLCDRILLGAYGRNKTRADKAMLRTAAREVMGEELNEEVGLARWPVAIAAALLVGLGGWWLLNQGRSIQIPVAATNQAPSQALPPAAEVPVAVPEPFVVTQEEPRESQVPVVAPPVEPVKMEPVSQWLLPTEDAEIRLWSLYSEDSPPLDTCPGETHAGLACIEGEAATWDELVQYNRPLLLELITRERFSAGVVLLGMEERMAWVAAGEGVQQLDLGELGPLWSGQYRFLWHPPPGFNQPLALGDTHPVVGEVAQLFARLDGQPQALAEDQFNAALQQRVRLFQQEQGLDDDGVVGVQTLLKLNEQLGIDVTAEAARREMASTGEVVQR